MDSMDAVGEEMEHQTTMTLEEFANQIEEDEEEADLLFGGEEGEKCTYLSGYLPRQAVFSCLTCTPEGDAGFCTACSLKCHDGHEVIELWTKRAFRCDCGNSKYGVMICKMHADKEPVNEHNIYNHNFVGKYCTCQRPYPDPVRDEAGVANDMMQCSICEDWFHEEHLGLDSHEKVPTGDDEEPQYESLLCKSCVENRCAFVSLYNQYVVKPHTATVADTSVKPTDAGNLPDVSPEVPLKSEKARETSSAEHVEKDESNGGEKTTGPSVIATGLLAKAESVAVEGTPVPTAEIASGSEQNAREATCPIAGRKAEATGKPLFMAAEWRSSLCKCPACLKIYEDNGIKFLLSEEDTIAHYEGNARSKRKSPMQRFENAFQTQFNRHQQVELLHGYNLMATELKEFLRSFGETGETVTAEHVHTFFDQLKAKRHQTQGQYGDGV